LLRKYLMQDMKVKTHHSNKIAVYYSLPKG
jgi:hypothetical protein